MGLYHTLPSSETQTEMLCILTDINIKEISTAHIQVFHPKSPLKALITAELFVGLVIEHGGQSTQNMSDLIR